MDSKKSTIHFDAHPPKQGLYDPALEKDACGVGFVADTTGIPTHATVKDAAEILRHLTHRGKILSGELQGLPHLQFDRACAPALINCPEVWLVPALILAGDLGKLGARHCTIRHWSASIATIHFGLTSLVRLCTGACGCETETGDGAGMLLAIPDKLYRKVCEFDLPQAGLYSSGIVYFPKDEDLIARHKKV